MSSSDVSVCKVMKHEAAHTHTAWTDTLRLVLQLQCSSVTCFWHLQSSSVTVCWPFLLKDDQAAVLSSLSANQLFKTLLIRQRSSFQPLFALNRSWILSVNLLFLRMFSEISLQLQDELSFKMFRHSRSPQDDFSNFASCKHWRCKQWTWWKCTHLLHTGSGFCSDQKAFIFQIFHVFRWWKWLLVFCVSCVSPTLWMKAATSVRAAGK